LCQAPKREILILRRLLMAKQHPSLAGRLITKGCTFAQDAILHYPPCSHLPPSYRFYLFSIVSSPLTSMPPVRSWRPNFRRRRFFTQVSVFHSFHDARITVWC
jgi:hypothetical protein